MYSDSNLGVVYIRYFYTRSLKLHIIITSTEYFYEESKFSQSYSILILTSEHYTASVCN